MWFRVLAISCFLSMATIDVALSREIPAGADSARSDSIKADSTKIYRDIESFSDHSKFTKFIYRLFFKPGVPGLPLKATKKRLVRKPFTSFQGKMIRDIKIETLDPFGNSIGDTIASSLNFLTKAGNKLHVKTFPRTIKNLLLVHKNQPFDSLRFKESERLVRSMSYITDVSFWVQEAYENSDSVDIVIRALDSWSILPGGSASSSKVAMKLVDNNFMGLGHEFKHGLVWNHSTGDMAYRTSYFIPNIHNTYINSTLKYGTDEFGNFIKSFAVDRPFFSPLAKWAAGVMISQQFHKDSTWTPGFMRFKLNAQDYWAGNAMRIFRDESEYSRTTNLVSAVRFVRVRYLEKPIGAIDTLRYYSDENFYLASLAISTRQYVQDKFFFKFGITEDVPVGKVFSLTAGYQDKNNSGRFYAGARVSSGNYFPWGYLSSNIEYGTFFHASKAEQGVLSAGARYVTGLMETGKWKFRQFVKPQVILGIHRTSYDSLTINDEYGLDGFNSPQVSGVSRILFTSQTQSYAPWNFIGFHFGPYATFSLAMVGSATDGFRSAKVYSLVGLGVLIKNENLVMNTFQLSLAYYPSIPGRGNHIFKINSFQVADFGFRDFEFGRPATAGYR